MNKERSRSNLLFFKQALKEFRSHGAILPSSRFLSARVASLVRPKVGDVIVELGAGTGAVSRELIKRLPAEGTLVLLELNPILVDYLHRTIEDSRVLVVEGDAADLPRILKELSLDKADRIVSGLPLGDFNKELREKILTAISESLNNDGRYIQFQYFLTSLAHIRKMFHVRIAGYEIRNVPPAFVYECKKKHTEIRSQ